MANYLTLADLRTAICKAIGDNAEARATEVDAVINQVYLNEILSCDELHPLHWLIRMDDSVLTKERATITAITKANPPVVTAVGHDFVDGDLVTIYGSDMTEVNNRTFLVDDAVASTSFELQSLEGTDIDGSGFAAAGTEGYAHHRGATLATTGKDIEKILDAGWVDYPGQFKPIGIEELNEKTINYWNDSLSLPKRYMHQRQFVSGVEAHRLFWFWCPDAAYRLRYWLEYRPARLTAVGDIPVMPYRFQHAIISGAITRLGENKAQVEAGVVWPQIYKLDLDAIKEYNRAWWAKNNPNNRSDLYLL